MLSNPASYRSYGILELRNQVAGLGYKTHSNSQNCQIDAREEAYCSTMGVSVSNDGSNRLQTLDTDAPRPVESWSKVVNHFEVYRSGTCHVPEIEKVEASRQVENRSGVVIKI